MVFSMCQFCSASEVTSKFRPGLKHIKNCFEILILLLTECLSVNLFSRPTFDVCEISTISEFAQTPLITVGNSSALLF